MASSESSHRPENEKQAQDLEENQDDTNKQEEATIANKNIENQARNYKGKPDDLAIQTIHYLSMEKERIN